MKDACKDNESGKWFCRRRKGGELYLFFFWPLSDYHRNSIPTPLFLSVHYSLEMIRLLKKIPIANENGIANGRHVPLDRALSLRFSSIWGYVGHSSATCEVVMILRKRGAGWGEICLLFVCFCCGDSLVALKGNYWSLMAS